MEDLLELQKQQIEALQKELEKKNIYLDKANALIAELYDAMLQDRTDSLYANAEAHDEIIKL